MQNEKTSSWSVNPSLHGHAHHFPFSALPLPNKFFVLLISSSSLFPAGTSTIYKCGNETSQAATTQYSTRYYVAILDQSIPKV